jgi:spermidine/putrescine transport system ATP-binding protein
VLLLDEPLGALDLKLRKEMQLELKKLQREVGITFVYVTHDQEEALTMSDRIAVMSGGAVLQVGAADEIYEQPNCRFVADFIGETNFLDGRVKEQRERTVEVELKSGLTLRAQADAQLSLARGQTVTVAVRPEKMHLRAGDLNGANALRGRVEAVVYIGTDTHYGVALPGDYKVRVREQNTHPASRPLAQTGDEVTVTFEQAAARVLTE